MAKHSEHDNQIVEFYDGIGEGAFVTTELSRTIKLLDGNCCALGHARRYVEEALLDMKCERYAIKTDNGEIVVKILRHGGEELCSWRLVRWKPIKV